MPSFLRFIYKHALLHCHQIHIDFSYHGHLPKINGFHSLICFFFPFCGLLSQYMACQIKLIQSTRQEFLSLLKISSEKQKSEIHMIGTW